MLPVEHIFLLNLGQSTIHITSSTTSMICKNIIIVVAFSFCPILFGCFVTVCGTKDLITPGTYRVLGAEGDASLTATPEPISKSINKVKMSLWTSSKEQEWTIVLKNGTQNFLMQNSVVENNVLTVTELDGKLSYREWKISKVDNGQWQIKDVKTNKCLSRLGITVYHEGSDCDSQVQPQHWRFFPWN